MIGPQRRPVMMPGDFHIVINDEAETAKAFDHAGKLLWKKPAMAKGVNGRTTWRQGGDTPPGLYQLGLLYRASRGESLLDVWYPYGPLCWDMEEMEGQENERGRAGICLHGGGSNAPDPLAPYQLLGRTHGCVRMHNKDLSDHVLPLTHEFKAGGWSRRKNAVYISVFQDYD
jgi:hypothetical protein